MPQLPRLPWNSPSAFWKNGRAEPGAFRLAKLLETQWPRNLLRMRALSNQRSISEVADAVKSCIRKCRSSPERPRTALPDGSSRTEERRVAKGGVGQGKYR